MPLLSNILNFVGDNLPWTPMGRGILAAREQAEMSQYRKLMLQRQQQQFDTEQSQLHAAQQAFKPGEWQPGSVPITPDVNSPNYAQAKAAFDQAAPEAQGKVQVGNIGEFSPQQAGLLSALASTGQFAQAGQAAREFMPQAPEWRGASLGGMLGQQNIKSGEFKPFPRGPQAQDDISVRELNVGDSVRYGRFNKAGDFLGYVQEPGGNFIGGPRASRDESGPMGPFAGVSIEAQDTNILLQGNPSSSEYHAAYARQAAPRVLPDGSRITPDMRPYRKPAGGQYAERIPGQPTVEPGGIRQSRQMTITMGDLVGNVKNTIAELKPTDRAAFVAMGVTTPAMAKAQAAFNLMLSQLRDPSLLNTGVLQSGELKWIEQMFAAPGSWSALIQGNAPTIAALDEIKVLMNAKRRGYEALLEQGGAEQQPQDDKAGGDRPPPDVAPEVWREMTPEQKKLWR